MFGIKLWKLGENPTQGRYCDSLFFLRIPLSNWEGVRKVSYGTGDKSGYLLYFITEVMIHNSADTGVWIAN